MRQTEKKHRSIDGIIPSALLIQNKSARQTAVKPLILLVIALTVGIFVTSYFAFVRQSPIVNAPGSNNGDLLSTVSRHYILPTDEVPAQATITDQSKVSSAFQGKAKNGDRLLIYQKNKQAVIYRPSVDRVVNVVPVQIDTPQGGTDPQ